MNRVLYNTRFLGTMLLQHFRQLGHDVVASIRWHEVDTLYSTASLSQQFLSHQEAFLVAALTRSSHAVANDLGNGNARDLVMQIFGMARAIQGNTTEQDGYRWFPHEFQETQQRC